MDIIEIKRSLAKMQKQGQWDEGIAYLQFIHAQSPGGEIAGLLLSEMYWLIKDYVYFQCNPAKMPLGYERIDYTKMNCFSDLFKAARHNYADELVFQWEIGYWILLDPTPFLHGFAAQEIISIGNQMMTAAVDLARETGIADLVKLTYQPTSKDMIDPVDKRAIFKELESLDLQANMSDENFREFLQFHIDAHTKR